MPKSITPQPPANRPTRRPSPVAMTPETRARFTAAGKRGGLSLHNIEKQAVEALPQVAARTTQPQFDWDAQLAKAKPTARWRRARATALRQAPNGMCQQCGAHKPVTVVYVSRVVGDLYNPKAMMAVCGGCQAALAPALTPPTDAVQVEGIVEPVDVARDPQRAVEAARGAVVVPEVLPHHRRLVAGLRGRPDRLDDAARRHLTLQMRVAGSSIQDIHQELGRLGYPIGLPALKAEIQESLDAVGKLDGVYAERVRALELTRLDAITTYLWPDLERGDVFAVQAYCKVAELRGKYLHLFQPESTATQGVTERPLAALPEDQLAARLQQFKERAAGTHRMLPPASALSPMEKPA